VRAGAVDLALIGTATAAAVPADHPMARQRQPTLRDVCDQPIVCLPRGTGLRTVSGQACAAQGIQPAIGLQASAADAIADLADRGLAVDGVATPALLRPGLEEHPQPGAP
jgi:DNA-binding transcriptional LysR family regulator